MKRKVDLFIKSNSKLYGRIKLSHAYITEVQGLIKGARVWIQGEEWDIVSTHTYVIELIYQSEKDSRTQLLHNLQSMKDECKRGKISWRRKENLGA